MNKGSIIKRLREEKGLSQVELARKIGVSKQTLYKYEKNIVTNIPSDKIEALAKALGTTPEVLMGWTELPKSPGGFMMPLSALTETDSSFGKDILDREYKKELSRRINEKQNSPIVHADGQDKMYKSGDAKNEIVVSDKDNRFSIHFRDGKTMSDTDKELLKEQIATTIDSFYKLRGIE